jgi:hypothetical protein
VVSDGAPWPGAWRGDIAALAQNPAAVPLPMAQGANEKSLVANADRAAAALDRRGSLPGGRVPE